MKYFFIKIDSEGVKKIHQMLDSLPFKRLSKEESVYNVGLGFNFDEKIVGEKVKLDVIGYGRSKHIESLLVHIYSDAVERKSGVIVISGDYYYDITTGVEEDIRYHSIPNPFRINGTIGCDEVKQAKN